jgi:hypothetical protein
MLVVTFFQHSHDPNIAWKYFGKRVSQCFATAFVCAIVTPLRISAGMIAAMQVSLYVEYTLRDTAFIAILAWMMYVMYLYGCLRFREAKPQGSAPRAKKQSPPNFSSFFCFAWLFYVIIFNYLANLHFQPLFVGIQARFYMQPNLLVVISSAMMLFHIFRCVPLSSLLVRVIIVLLYLVACFYRARCNKNMYFNTSFMYESLYRSCLCCRLGKSVARFPQ